MLLHILIAHTHLSIIQANFPFKCLDMRTFVYTTPTFIAEVLCLVILAQLLLMTVTVN